MYSSVFRFSILALSMTVLVACGGSSSSGSNDDSSGSGGGAIQNFTVSTQTSNGGSISPSSRTVQSGNTTTFTLTPDADYEIAEVGGCGGNLNENTYTTGAITTNCTVTATFDKIEYTATANFSQGGSLAPTQVTAKVGERVEFQVAVDDYYYLESIAGCEGELVGDMYVIEAIASNCSVSANFAEDYVQLTGSAPHISDETNLIINVDGFSQDEVSLVAHEGDIFTVQLRVSEDKVNTDERIRLRVNGRGESGNALQYTATLPSVRELYSGDRTYLDTHDIDSLRVTALTTVMDAYATSLLSNQRFDSEQFENALEVFSIDGINSRLIVAEAIFQDNLFALPVHSTNLHHLLSSWSKVNVFIQLLDASTRRNFLNDASGRLEPSALFFENVELYAFDSLFRESESSAYLSIDENKIAYASSSNGWFNPALEFTREDGKLIISLPPLQGSPETASESCFVFDNEINSISNPEGVQYQVACKNRLSSVWVALTLNGEYVLAQENERHIYAQELWSGVEISAQTDYTTSLQRYSSLPANWNIGSSQINAKGGDLWVLPSLEGTQGTNLFKLNSDNTYKEKLLFESELEGFDAYRNAHPGIFSESGMWILADSTTLKLAFGHKRWANIQKIESDDGTLRYLVTFEYGTTMMPDDEGVRSKRVLRLGRVNETLSPQVFFYQTQGELRLNAIYKGGPSLNYPSIPSTLFAWDFNEFGGSTVAAQCDSVAFSNDNCDGNFELRGSYTFEVELLENYLLTKRLVGNNTIISRAFAALKLEDDEMLIFEQGIIQNKLDFLDYDLFNPWLNGRLVEWQSIELQN